MRVLPITCAIILSLIWLVMLGPALVLPILVGYALWEAQN